MWVRVVPDIKNRPTVNSFSRTGRPRFFLFFKFLSPKKIVFSSNFQLFEENFRPKMQKFQNLNPAFMLDLGPHCSFWIVVLTQLAPCLRAGLALLRCVDFSLAMNRSLVMLWTALLQASSLHTLRWTTRAWRRVNTFLCGVQLCKLHLHTLTLVSHAR